MVLKFLTLILSNGFSALNGSQEDFDTEKAVNTEGWFGGTPLETEAFYSSKYCEAVKNYDR